MKKLMIIIILAFSCNFAFAEDPTAKMFIKDGETISGLELDATGFKHGIEMNTPGTAWIKNTQVKNAGTGYVGPGPGFYGDGVGIIASVPGAHILIVKSKAINNSEDGFRAINGGKLTILNGVASRNGKNGFFVGHGSILELTNGTAFRNTYGFMGAGGFLSAKIIDSNIYANKNQGVHLIEGNIVDIKNTQIYNNDSNKVIGIDYGGISIYGVKEVDIYDSTIRDNYGTGIYADSDSTFNDAPVRVFMKKVTIERNGEVAVESRGNSIVTIIDSKNTVSGKCLEEADPQDPTSVGIITVDGEAVIGDVCP